MRWLVSAAAVGAAMVVGVSASAVAPQSGGTQGSQGASPTFRMDPQIGSRLDLVSGGGSQLGVTLRDLDAATVRERTLPSAEGVYVESVQPGGAADKGGLRAGDVISDFDGEHVRSTRQLRRLLAETPERLAVKIGVLRDGNRLELSVTPGPVGRDLDDSFAELMRGLDSNSRGLPPIRLQPLDPRERGPFDDWSSGAGRVGIVAQEMTPQLTEYFGAKEGVLVSSVTEDSPAARAGLRAGDVVTAVGGVAVKTVSDLARAIRSVPEGQEVEISLVRNRQPLALKVKPGGSRLEAQGSGPEALGSRLRAEA